ncbi:hypothetical protein Hanom_Chr10g00954191 [Helianthus anomalus]
MHHSSDSWFIRRPKPEPEDTVDIPPSNPHDPIDLESSPERLVKKKVGKRKQTDAEGQPAKKVQTKKITQRGNLDAFISGPVPEKAVGGGNLEVDKSVDVAAGAEKITSPDVVDDAGNPQTPDPAAHDSEKGKGAEDIPVVSSPPKASGSMSENIEKVTTENQGSFSDAGQNSPIRPDETLGDYYYRTYSEKDASEIHAPVWNLKKGDTFSDWRVCRDWLQGIFPLGEIRFQESRLHEQTYHAYLEEVASHTSTTYRIMQE